MAKHAHPAQDAVLALIATGGWWTTTDLCKALSRPPDRLFHTVNRLVACNLVVRRQTDGYGYANGSRRWEYHHA